MVWQKWFKTTFSWAPRDGGCWMSRTKQKVFGGFLLLAGQHTTPRQTKGIKCSPSVLAESGATVQERGGGGEGYV